MNQSKTQNSNANPGHLAWLDNLRTFIVFLVVLLHAGGVYEVSGTWASFWIVDDPATNNLSGLVIIVLDIFLMPVLFLISGYLAPASLAGKGGWRFIKAKFKRLVLPWLVAVLTLIPLYKVIFLASRGLPQQAWTTYFHFSNGGWGMNWLWFLPALFTLNLIYLGLVKSKIRLPDIPIRCTVVMVFVIGFIYSLVMDIYGLRGWTKLPFMDFQNERVLIYLLAFLLGARIFRKDAFAGKPRLGWLYYSLSATNWIPIMLYIVLLLYPWINPGQYIVSELFHRALLWLNFQLSLFSMGYLLIQTFRRYLNGQGSLARLLSRCSYSIYIVHVVVQGAVAWYMLQLPAPSFLKHLLLAILSYAVSTLLVSCYGFAVRKLRRQLHNESAQGTSTLPDNLVEHGASGQAG